MTTHFSRRTLVEASPELAKQVQLLGSVELRYADPEQQESAAQVLLDQLRERGALTVEEAGEAFLNETGGPIQCVSINGDLWLEIHATTGRVDRVSWPDAVESEGGEP